MGPPLGVKYAILRRIIVKGIFLGGGFKANRFPCWGQSYKKKVNKLSIPDYSYMHSYENSALSAPCLITCALTPYFSATFSPTQWLMPHHFGVYLHLYSKRLLSIRRFVFIGYLLVSFPFQSPPPPHLAIS